jgi:hypothetical protein
MSDFEISRENEIIWPTDGSDDIVVPGRPDFEPTWDKSRGETFDSFKSRRRKLINEIGSGGNSGRPPTGEIIGPQELPPPTDYCAYYWSFRFPRNVGIYIRIECWFSISKYLHANGIPDEASVDEAFMMLFRHEYFHFAVDRATAILERAAGLSSGMLVDNWIPYHRANNPSLLEEALANANAYKNAGKGNPAHRARVRELLAHWMRLQPAGYRDFEKMNVRKGDLGLHRARLLSDIMTVRSGIKGWARGLESLILSPSFAKPGQDCFAVSFEDHKIPIYFE